MSNVFVLDTQKRALNPVHPGWARKLLRTGQAAIWRRYPFTIILKKEVAEPMTQPLRLKLDPGSKTTGIAIVNDASGEVVFAAELTHRGQHIKAALDDRRAVRHSRRQRKTRYRKPRFDNRKKPDGWLAPSLMSRMYNIETWVRRLLHGCPVTALSQEVARFDTQRLENPEISGVEYQQGALLGYEVREYVLEKWGRKCAYCDVTGVPLEVEHIVCRARHGSNRISNLTLACRPCNNKKGTQDIREFLKHDPARLTHLLAYAQALAEAYWNALGVEQGELKDNAHRTGNASELPLHKNKKTMGTPSAVTQIIDAVETLPRATKLRRFPLKAPAPPLRSNKRKMLLVALPICLVLILGSVLSLAHLWQPHGNILPARPHNTTAMPLYQSTATVRRNGCRLRWWRSRACRRPRASPAPLEQVMCFTRIQ